MSLLEVKELTKNFGGLAAVSNVDFAIEENELVGLIGPNGAGKTTFFNLLTGVYVPTEGTIELEIDNKKVLLNGKAPYKITDLGLARTFQNIRLFKELTVIDNVLIAMHSTMGESTFHSLLRTPTYYRKEAEMRWKRNMTFWRKICLTGSNAVWKSSVLWRQIRRSSSLMSRLPV